MSPGERFDRQIRFAPLGREGQAGLERSRVLLVGCGALGGSLAQILVRAGVGELVLVDRDVVELSNLPRQVLFDERHAREGTPKALAAVETLERVGGPTRLVPHVAQVDARNLTELAGGAALLLDGTDNLETRYLLNDYAVLHGVPWIYAGVVGASGLVLPVLPRGSMTGSRPGGACLACLFPSAPPPGVLPTCDTAGVILPAVALVASLAAGFALRILARGADDVEPALCELDAWGGAVRRLPAPRDPECRVCGQGIFEHLHRPAPRDPLVLCGRNAVQIPAAGAPPAFEALAERLAGATEDLQSSRAFLRFSVEGSRFTVFRDGRVLVEGTSDPRRARALADRWIGS